MGDRVITGDLAELVAEIVDHLIIAGRLILGHERVQIGEFGPGDGDHLNRGVELHRAGAKRDHRTVQRQITVGEAAHIARHLSLGAVPVEGRMGEICALAQTCIRQAIGLITGCFAINAKGAPDGLNRVIAGHLIDRDADLGIANFAQVDPFGHSGLHDGALQRADLNRDGVKEHLWFDGKSVFLQPVGKTCGAAVDGLGNRLNPVGAVVDRVHRRHHSQQGLGGTNV